MHNLLRAGAMALACAALSGCADPLTLSNPFGGSSTGAARPSITLTGDPFVDFNPILGKLAAFTQADVQNALADAKAQKDPVGELCWQVVLDNLPAIQTQQQAKSAGAATAIQSARDLQNGIPKIADACATILPAGLAALGAAVVGGL